MRFFSFILFVLIAVHLHSAELPPALPGVKEKHILTQAIQIQMTPRGAQLFEKNLLGILGNLGISIDEAYIDNYNWQAEASYQLENLDLPKDTKDLIINVRNVLRDWFIGFPLKDIRPAVAFGLSGYQAVFKRFAIVPDEKLLKELGKSEGAVLSLEMVIEKIDISTERLRAYDLNTPELGEIGLDQVDLNIAGGKVPLTIRLPFYVRINDKGIPEFQALGIEQNFDQIDMEIKYQRLITPTIQLTINGKTMELNKDRLEKELLGNLPQALVEVRKYLSKFASEKIPGLLNEKARQAMVKNLEEVKPLDPPGADVGTVPPFQWGLQLKSVNQNQGLYFTLDTFVEDPQNPSSRPQTNSSATGRPSMNTLTKDQFDVALSIDQAMINRLLQLSFERKYFEKIPLDGTGNSKPECIAKGADTSFDTTGKFLRLNALPVATAPDWSKLPRPAWGETFANLKLQVQVPEGTVSGFDEWFLNDRFIIKFNLIIKLIASKNAKALEVQLWEIDSNSITLEEGSLTWLGKLAKGSVIKNLKKEFGALSSEWKCQGTRLPGIIPIPELFGIKVKLKHVVMEPQGQLIMYLEYENQGS
jgi:hypothetical protein